MGETHKEIIYNAKNKTLLELRSRYDFYCSLFIALMIATTLNGLEILRDLASNNSFWKIGLLVEIIFLIILSSIPYKKEKLEVAISIRKLKKHNSEKEARKMVDEYLANCLV